MSVQEKYKPSLAFSGGINIPTKGFTVPMGSKACKVSQKTVDPKGGDFPVTTQHQHDGLFFSQTI